MYPRLADAQGLYMFKVSSQLTTKFHITSPHLSCQNVPPWYNIHRSPQERLYLYIIDCLLFWHRPCLCFVFPAAHNSNIFALLPLWSKFSQGPGSLFANKVIFDLKIFQCAPMGTFRCTVIGPRFKQQIPHPHFWQKYGCKLAFPGHLIQLFPDVWYGKLAPASSVSVWVWGWGQIAQVIPVIAAFHNQIPYTGCQIYPFVISFSSACRGISSGNHKLSCLWRLHNTSPIRGSPDASFLI